MSEMERYLVPDYYPAFSCKMGACRHPCCEGWPVSITMKDYFTLLSVDCSPELRRKLDCALHLAPHPYPEAYAQITPNYDGNCPLHLPDGRCALQAELGAEVLATVCQLYPRGARTGDHLECSCAASCEAVPEMLLHRQKPLQFISVPLHFDLPKAPPRRNLFHTAGREQEIRLWLIRQMQNRAYPLPQRMVLLGYALQAMDEALAQWDDQRVTCLLSGAEALPVPPALSAGHDQLQAGLATAERMLAIMDQTSNSIHDYGEAALSHFTQADDLFACYRHANDSFAALIPQWETWFEHLLVNHMFFAQFPFQDRPVPLKDEYLALCAVYTLLRFLAVGWTALHPTIDEAVDVIAAAFRLIEHTEFDRYAAPLLKQLHCDDWTRLMQILCL